MEASWLNPFNPDQGELLGLLPRKQKKPRTFSKPTGYGRRYRLSGFQARALQAIAPSTQFHEEISKRKLKTFSGIRKSHAAKTMPKRWS